MSHPEHNRERLSQGLWMRKQTLFLFIILITSAEDSLSRVLIIDQLCERHMVCRTISKSKLKSKKVKVKKPEPPKVEPYGGQEKKRKLISKLKSRG